MFPASDREGDDKVRGMTYWGVGAIVVTRGAGSRTNRDSGFVIARIDAASEELETRAELEAIERIDRGLRAIVILAQVPEEISRDPGALAALIEQQRVTSEDETFRVILNGHP